MILNAGRDKGEDNLDQAEELVEDEIPLQDEINDEEVEATEGDVAEERVEEQGREEKEELEKEYQEELAKKNEKIEELMMQIARLQADYNNLKRRSEEKIKNSIDYGIESLAKELLPVMDNFERALEAEEDRDNSFYEGIKMIYNQLLGILESNSIKEIEALHQPFDPNMHNAVMVEESDEYEEGTVIGILQKGYHFKDKVLRPVTVIVSK